MNAASFGYPLLRDRRQAPEDGLGRHEKETREQVKRLERAFKPLGVRPRRRKAAGIEGLAEEFAESAGSVARALGETEVRQLLERNLKEEKGMLADAGKHARWLNEAAAALEN